MGSEKVVLKCSVFLFFCQTSDAQRHRDSEEQARQVAELQVRAPRDLQPQPGQVRQHRPRRHQRRPPGVYLDLPRPPLEQQQQ